MERTAKTKINPYMIPGLNLHKIKTQLDLAEIMDATVGSSISEITEVVLRVFNVVRNTHYTMEFVKSKNRKRELVEIRQCAMYYATLLTSKSLKQIGMFFNGRDHSTVIHGRQTWEVLVSSPFNRELVQIDNKIKQIYGITK